MRLLAALLVVGASALAASSPSTPESSTVATKAVEERRSQTTFEVELVPKGSTPRPDTWRFRAVRKGSSVVEGEVGSAGKFTLTLEAAEDWLLSVEGRGYWIRPIALDARSPRAIAMEAWPLGIVTGRLRVGSQGKLPEFVTLTTIPPRRRVGGSALPRGSQDCAVVRGGLFRCEAPATIYDLAVGAPGRIPSYRFGVEIPPRSTVDLGVINLIRGSSVAGWVEVVDGTLDPKSCRIRLARLAAGVDVRQSSAAQERMAAAGRIDRQGFFQLQGVAPGAYAIDVEHRGFATKRLAPVEVGSSTETFIRDPIRLERPLTLRLSLDPALDPYRRPWRVEVTRLAGFGAPLDRRQVFSGFATVDGTVTVAEMAQGRYGVRVGLSSGGWLFDREDLFFADSEPQQIALSIFSFEGMLRLGEEPISGQIWFGGRSGPTSSLFEADVEGRFSGYLGRRGRQVAEIYNRELGIETIVEVEFVEEEAERATVEIVLATSAISGRARFEGGAPAAGATVHLSQEEGMNRSTTADSEGRFSFGAVPAGRVGLTALMGDGSGDARSDPQVLELGEEEKRGGVDLELRVGRQFALRLVAEGNPVPGATAFVLEHRPRSGYGSAHRSDVLGEIQASVRSSTEAVLVLMATPGFSLRAHEVLVTPQGSMVDLPMGFASGSLTFSLLGARSGEILIEQDGLPLPFGVLVDWARRQGAVIDDPTGPLTVPSLAPGHYRVCWPKGENEASCREGVLSAGGTLVLGSSSER